MNITSFIANKCLEFLLNNTSDLTEEPSVDRTFSTSDRTSFQQEYFPLPWAQNTQTFRSNCDCCGNCLSVCENNIIVRDKDGYPQVDFSIGHCSFCRACVESCPCDVFKNTESVPPWTLKAWIHSNCLSQNNVLCRTCADYCDYNAIIFSKNSNAINTPKVATDKCNGCGACFDPCPVNAISINNTVGSD